MKSIYLAALAAILLSALPSPSQAGIRVFIDNGPSYVKFGARDHYYHGNRKRYYQGSKHHKHRVKQGYRDGHRHGHSRGNYGSYVRGNPWEYYAPVRHSYNRYRCPNTGRWLYR